MSTKILYAIFFSCDSIAIQVPVPKGKSVTGQYYYDVVLKKLQQYYQKRHPVTGLQHVCLLHDNAHTSEIVKQFLKSEKVTHPLKSMSRSVMAVGRVCHGRCVYEVSLL